MNHSYLCKIIMQDIHALIFVQLNWMLKKNTIFQSIECFNVAPAQFCVPMSDYTFKVNYKSIVLELWTSVFAWIIFHIRLYL